MIDEAAAFAHVAGSTLRLAIRIETVEQLNADLKTAMATRTVIDLASGAIMAQNRCTQEEAFNLITKASSHRNEKVHKVATDIITHLAGTVDGTLHFEDQPPCATAKRRALIPVQGGAFSRSDLVSNPLRLAY